MNRRLFYWVNIIAPLLFGAAVYLYWRPDTYLSRLVFHFLHISHRTAAGRPVGIYRFIRYYLCDILWVYALVFSLAFYSGRHSLVMAYAAAAAFAVVTELLQLLPRAPGSFDILDIIVELIVCTITIFIIYSYEWRHAL